MVHENSLKNLKRGNNGNRGKPKRGRIILLERFDKLLAEKMNLDTLIDALQKQLTEKPLSFIKEYVYPLLPKETKLSADDDDNWKITIERIDASSKDKPAA